VAERAPDCLPGTALVTALLLYLELAHHHRRTPHSRSPPSIQVVIATHDLINDYRTEHTVGRADTTPGAGEMTIVVKVRSADDVDRRLLCVIKIK
jgi:hypothetical protein